MKFIKELASTHSGLFILSYLAVTILVLMFLAVQVIWHPLR